MTPHIEAKKEDIKKQVIMPGDPLRAKMIAETYLENPKLINSVRGMLGYTGTYKNKEVTVLASGMGCPSMGIYSYELFKFYDVEEIIRIGSVGAYKKEFNLYDTILETECYSDSNYAKIQNGYDSNTLYPSNELNEKIKLTAQKLNMNLKEGKIYSSDVFYTEIVDYKKMYEETGCIGVEMESFALFSNAKHLNKKAATILTVSNNFETNEETTSDERQNAFTDMVILALESFL